MLLGAEEAGEAAEVPSEGMTLPIKCVRQDCFVEKEEKREGP